MSDSIKATYPVTGLTIELKKIYTVSIEVYANGEWQGTISFNEIVKALKEGKI